MQRIVDLHEKAIDKFIKDWKIKDIKIGHWSTLKSQKTRKLEKINEWIKLHYPDWETDEDGFYLIKHKALLIESKSYLNQFKIVEIQVLAKHMGLHIDFKSKSKTEILEEFKEKAIEKFPFMKCTASGNLIIDPHHFA